jgi:hypothetical protein
MVDSEYEYYANRKELLVSEGQRGERIIIERGGDLFVVVIAWSM